MSMLSSVAERLYWMARYLERAEGMAFLCNAYSHFILDTPKSLIVTACRGVVQLKSPADATRP